MNRDPKNIETLIEEIEGFRERNRELQRLVDDLSGETRTLSEKEKTWRNIMDGSRDGCWDWHYGSNNVSYSKRWKEMLGFREDEISNRLHEWEDRLHPDDREIVFNNLDRHIKGETTYYENEYRLRCKDGSYKWILDRGKIVERDQYGNPLKIVGTQRDITMEREIEIENQRLINELEKALNKVKLLSGLLPICAKCKQIRDDKGYWNQIECYIRDHSEVEFSHSICPECIEEMYPNFRARGK
jgi:PAS domain S-box-containing protein